MKVGEVKVRRRGGTEEARPVWDYQGVAFHAFRKACDTLLLAHGKSLKQVQGWLRHSQLTTTMNVYIHQVDDGLGGTEAWDEILAGGADARGHLGATGHPETAANEDPAEVRKPLSRAILQTAANRRKHGSALIIGRSLVRVQAGPWRIGGAELPTRVGIAPPEGYL
jgi:hypothetical protein